MKRLLWVIVLLTVLLGRASTLMAEPLERSNSTGVPARFTADGGSYLAEGMRWIGRFWDAAMGVPMTKADAPPPPGGTNGSCVDPDGGGHCSH